MIGYYHPHLHPWKGMRGISREGHPMRVWRIQNYPKTGSFILSWRDLDTGRRAVTNQTGRVLYYLPVSNWRWMDVLWWELPTAEQVLLTPKEKV